MDAVVGKPSSHSGRQGIYRIVLWVTAGVLAAALVVGGILAWQWHSRRAQQSQQVEVVLAESREAYDKSDFINALNLVRHMDTKAVSTSQKARVYQAAALAAAGANQLKTAVHYYELRHQADPSTVNGDAYTLAVLYERLGEKDKALAQYKIALAFAKTTASQYGSDVPAIQAVIKELEQRK